MLDIPIFALSLFAHASVRVASKELSDALEHMGNYEHTHHSKDDLDSGVSSAAGSEVCVQVVC